MLKDVKVMFKIGKAHLDTVDQLAKKLKLSRSKVIRLGLDEVLAKYKPGYKGEWQIINTEFLNIIIGNLGNRIFELENPKGQLGVVVQSAAEASKKVDELRRQGKDKEADRIINERAKKGLYTGYTAWQDDK